MPARTDAQEGGRSTGTTTYGAIDFVIDRTEDARRPKMMPVVDEYTRECLALEVERSITAKDVV